MTGIEELQEIESLAAAYLPENYPVRPVAEGGLEEVADAHRRQAVLCLPGLETNQVVLIHLNFGCVFD